MCLITLALGVHSSYPFVIVANRDEFHHRPTAAAAFWEDAPDVLAGRDLDGGGTWLGLTRSGRVAALTNYREPERHRANAPSRGLLVADFLRGTTSPEAYVTELASNSDHFNGFNLLVGQGPNLWYFGNRGAHPTRLEPGIYGLSNHLLDTPWPKVKRSANKFRTLLSDGSDLTADDLLAVADGRDPAPDEDLPNTGVPIEWERLLSAPLIVSPDYGTRSSTVVMIDAEGRATFAEHTRDPSGAVTDIRSYKFEITEAPGF